MNGLYIAIITGCFTLLGACIPLWLQFRQTEKDKKQLLVSELEGILVYRSQLFRSRFEMEIQSEFYNYRYFRTKDQLDMIEAIRLIHKIEDLTIEIARINQKFLEKIGLISILFRPSKKISAELDNNKNFQVPIYKSKFNSGMSIGELEKNKLKANEELMKIIEEEYNKKPKKLITELKKII